MLLKRNFIKKSGRTPTTLRCAYQFHCDPQNGKVITHLLGKYCEKNYITKTVMSVNSAFSERDFWSMLKSPILKITIHKKFHRLYKCIM